MAYEKPEVLAQNEAEGVYAASCCTLQPPCVGTTCENRQ
jgi:hypothetical protein